MFAIYGGKQEFAQWDLDQLVTNPCMEEGSEVVFKARGKTYETTAFVMNGEVVADVPNFLLQEPCSITVDLGWGLDVRMECRTVFNVVEREKPVDYCCEYNIKNRENNNSGGDGVSSWNDMPDKPFGETTVMGDTLYWNGNTEGLVSAAGQFYKVSDEVMLKENLTNGMRVALSTGDEQAYSYDEIVSFMEADGFAALDALALVPYDNYVFDGITFPEKGVYFFFYEGIGYVTSLTIPGYNGFETTIVKTIDPEYLPEALRFGEVDDAVLLPPTQFFNSGSVSVADGSLIDMFVTPANINFVVGKTYTVNWNGTDYVTVCFEGMFNGISTPMVGNPVAVGAGDNNNLPFVSGCMQGLVAAVPLDGSEKLSVGITGYAIKPIPTKFLTNAVPFCVQVMDGGESYFCNTPVQELEEAYKSGRYIYLKSDTKNDDLEIVTIFTLAMRHRMGSSGEYEYGFVYDFAAPEGISDFRLVPNAGGTYDVIVRQ